ncbi:hypothetical protein [Fluviicoccus keumensis]|uniref:hypothetical protein n=1 Tax=Fluviicoccus keumensis TaxID=1435465 RepID=UPI00102B31B0|nr:hypothetical protein [Fluviicoccus keumensis]
MFNQRSLFGNINHKTNSEKFRVAILGKSGGNSGNNPWKPYTPMLRPVPTLFPLCSHRGNILDKKRTTKRALVPTSKGQWEQASARVGTARTLQPNACGNLFPLFPLFPPLINDSEFII